MAIRLAASFPNARPPVTTIAEWELEFLGLEEEQAESVLENIKERFDKPPSIREIRRVVLTIKNRREGFGPDELGYRERALPVGERATWAKWAAENPDRARRFMKVLTGTSYVRKEIEQVIADGEKAFDG